MKRKVFLQVSIILYAIIALFLAIIAGALYVVVEFFRLYIIGAGIFEWASLIAAIAAIIFLSYMIIRLMRNRIIIEESEIYVPAYWGKSDNKAQHELRIRYDEIENIVMIASNKNSLYKSVSHFFSMPYIIFNCKNGEQKAVNVLYYSKKQVVEIIDTSILRARENGNDLQISTGKELLRELLENEKNKRTRK